MAVEGVCEMSALYEKLAGRPVFTREIIEAANSITHQINNGELRSEQEYQVPDLLGNIQRLKTPKLSKDEELYLQFNCYQRHAMNMRKDGTIINPDKAVSFQVIAIPTTSHTRDQECHVKPNSPAQWETWKAEWNSSSICTHLTNILVKNAFHLSNIDQILCFALGSLHASHKPKPYIQHLAACTIRDTLESLPHPNQATSPLSRRRRRRRIRILAQDPTYCAQCTHILAHHLSLPTTTSSTAFLQITKNTLIICISPSAPILQIITDLTMNKTKTKTKTKTNFNDGPPTAILCNAIQDNPLSLDGPLVTLPTEDEPTTATLAYRDSCLTPADIFSDDVEYAARYGQVAELKALRARVAEAYPGLWEEGEPPPMGAVIARWVGGGDGDGAGAGAGEGIEGLREHAGEYWGGRVRACFRDLRVYVRKGEGECG